MRENLPLSDCGNVDSSKWAWLALILVFVALSACECNASITSLPTLCLLVRAECRSHALLCPSSFGLRSRNLAAPLHRCLASSSSDLLSLRHRDCNRLLLLSSVVVATRSTSSFLLLATRDSFNFFNVTLDEQSHLL